MTNQLDRGEAGEQFAGTMRVPSSLPQWLQSVPVERVVRIDAGLEGQWSETVTAVWSPESGVVNFSDVVRSHPDYRPALELYLDDCWIGIPCSVFQDGRHVLDEDKARQLIEYVASRQP
jgi:hypothetical protein